MSSALVKNVGAWLKSAYAADSTSLTAAGTGDNTAVTGATVDRSAYGQPMSASVIYACKATLSASQKLTLAYKVQHGSASNGSDMADFAVGSTGATVLTATGTTTVKQDVDLTGAKRYIRIYFTPDLDASGTDAAVIQSAWVFGPTAELP